MINLTQHNNMHFLMTLREQQVDLAKVETDQIFSEKHKRVIAHNNMQF